MPNPIDLPVVRNDILVPMTLASGQLAVEAVSPHVDLEEVPEGVNMTVRDVDGTETALIPKGDTGNPGVHYGTDEPTDPEVTIWVDPSGAAGELTATVSKDGHVATIEITDKDGTTTAEVHDGESGVYYGTEEPADPDATVWIDPSGAAAELAASVTKVGKVATISITDKDGTTTAEIHDGEDGQDGQDGQDGVSPTITATEITGGHRLTITDADGEHTVDVMDGADGQDGQDGAPGQDGADGADGVTFTPTVSAEGVISWSNDGGRTNPASVSIKGPQGEPGQDGADGQNGINGTNAYVWIRYAAAQPTQDSDMKTTPDAWMGIYSGDAATAPTAYTSYTWYNIKGQTGPVTDVQVNSSSVVTGGVANVPIGKNNTLGVVKVSQAAGTAFGVSIDNSGQVQTAPANEANIKDGGLGKAPIVPATQHFSAFYGLAKAAGADEKNSTLSSGVYSETAKSKISDMLNAPVSVSGSTPSITGMPGVRYICGECSTLSITAPESGIIDVTFESGSTPTVLTVSSAKTGVTNIRWANGFDSSNLDADTTYEISIMDGELGAALSWT